jgi:phosphoglucomutase
MPTSTAADRVAAGLGIPAYETPTGWKYFGNLMDAGLCTICGEESFGTGSDHVREKDGIWAVLCWLSILAATGVSVAEVLRRHWQRFGRSYYQRHDYEGLRADAAGAVLRRLKDQILTLPGREFAGSKISKADEFSYTDPVDGSVSSNQGIRIFTDDQSRVVCRLSGTGTEGATLRIYLERFRPDQIDLDVSSVISPLAESARTVLGLKELRESAMPDVIT